MGSNPAYMPFSYTTSSLKTLECQAAPINPPLALSCRATNAELHIAYGTCGESANAELQCKSCPECAAAAADTEADDTLRRSQLVPMM
jgi:hypothetical protein